MEIKLTIIMPSLNVADYIEECMDSALNQTLKNIEILCIDAGSIDGTWEILGEYEKKLSASDKIVKRLHSDVKSYGYQVNMGIRLARGKYIAVLETDDYAEECMYEKLACLAEKYDLDYVKADYDRFFLLNNGERYYEKVALWGAQPGNYNIVMNPSAEDYLYANDYNIWKGIYKKDFLRQNQIWLNETPGAAFQDIGFAQQVLACAQKAYYTDLSLYRYRMDREGSSINSYHGMRYSRQEFSRLLSDSGIYSKLVCRQGLYRHMAQSFRGEYRKLLALLNYDADSESLKADYEWFRNILMKAVERSEFVLESLPEGFRKDLVLLLEDCKNYAEKMCRQEAANRARKELLLKKAEKKEVVVFGTGCLGNIVIKTFLRQGIKPVALFDNNAELWGKELYGIPIKCPENVGRDICVVIANKQNGEEMEMQLTDMGVDSGQIVLFQDK